MDTCNHARTDLQVIRHPSVNHLGGSLLAELNLTLHFLPGYAPELNPDELVWRNANRTGVARQPKQKGEKLEDRVCNQLQAIADDPRLVPSFFKHPTVAYISDC